MSSAIGSPPPVATASRNGLMSAADKAAFDQALTDINQVELDVVALEVAVASLQAQAHDPVTLAGSNPPGWLSFASQVLSLALVSASNTVAGVVDLAAQSFTGVKTFLSAVVMSAGLTVTGLVSATRFNSGSGSASDVAFGPTGDVNTGIWFPAPDTLNIVTNGSLAMQFASTGAVYLGANNRNFYFGTGNSYVYSDGVTLHFGTYVEIASAANLQVSTILAHAATTMRVLAQNGSGSSDVCNKSGTTLADGSMHASAKIHSWCSGIGGTEVEKAYLLKGGYFSTLGGHNTADPSSGGGFQFGGTAVLWESGSTLVLRARGSGANYSSTTPAVWIVPFGAVDADDLILSVATSAGAARFTVNGQGDAVAEGNVKLNNGGIARPTADASNRGKLWYSKSAGGVADTVEICLKSAGDTYAWVTLATG